jgi:hypothetical protein
VPVEKEQWVTLLSVAPRTVTGVLRWKKQQQSEEAYTKDEATRTDTSSLRDQQLR